MFTMKPIGDRMLVTPYRRAKTKEGGIMLTDPFKDMLTGDDHTFWVVAVGPRVKEVKVKDRVICAFDHNGLEILEGDGTKRGFIRESQVLVVIPYEEPSTHSQS